MWPSLYSQIENNAMGYYWALVKLYDHFCRLLVSEKDRGADKIKSRNIQFYVVEFRPPPSRGKTVGIV